MMSTTGASFSWGVHVSTWVMRRSQGSTRYLGDNLVMLLTMLSSQREPPPRLSLRMSLDLAHVTLLPASCTDLLYGYTPTRASSIKAETLHVDKLVTLTSAKSGVVPSLGPDSCEEAMVSVRVHPAYESYPAPELDPLSRILYLASSKLR